MNKYDFVKTNFSYEKELNKNEKFEFTSIHEIKNKPLPNKYFGGRNIRRVETIKGK